MEKIPAAVVGLGRIGSLLEQDALREKPCTHAGALAANGECVIAAGCDVREERRRLFAAAWGCPVYDDAVRMLRTHRPKILCVATHPDSHEYYCRLAAAEGVPVVICEKPLADTRAAARRIAALHRRGTVRILTNHERRYGEDYAQARAILEAGGLGPVLSVKAALCMGNARPLREVLWHDGTHLADALMFLSGGFLLKHRRTFGASLSGRRGTAFLEGFLTFVTLTACPPGTGKRIPCLIELGAERDHLIFELEFSCARGRLRIGNGIFEVWKSEKSPYAEGFRSLARVREGFTGPTGYFARMIADAAACVREPGREPRSSALDGLRVIEYLHSVG